MGTKTKVVAVGLKLEVQADRDLDSIERMVLDAITPGAGYEVLDTVVHPDPDVIFSPDDGDTCATCAADLLWDDSARMYYCPNTWEHG